MNSMMLSSSQKHGYVGVPSYPVSDTYRIRIRRGYAGDTSPSRIGVLGCIGPRNSRLDTYLCVIRPSSPTPWEYPPLPCRIRPPHARRCTRLRREGWGRSCWGRRLREMVAVRWEESRQPTLPTPRGRARGGLPAHAPRQFAGELVLLDAALCPEPDPTAGARGEGAAGTRGDGAAGAGLEAARCRRGRGRWPAGEGRRRWPAEKGREGRPREKREWERERDGRER